MKLLLPRLLGFTFVAAFAVGCASPSASQDGPGQERPPLDPAITQELQGRPSYTIASTAIRGEYRTADGDPGCADALSECEAITVTRENNRTAVWLGGSRYGYEATEVWSEDGVILFSYTGWGDCDNPGCGDVVGVLGVIYPAKSGDTWVPRVKLTLDLEYMHPEEEDAPYGEFRHVARLEKWTPPPP